LEDDINIDQILYLGGDGDGMSDSRKMKKKKFPSYIPSIPVVKFQFVVGTCPEIFHMLGENISLEMGECLRVLRPPLSKEEIRKLKKLENRRVRINIPMKSIHDIELEMGGDGMIFLQRLKYFELDHQEEEEEEEKEIESDDKKKKRSFSEFNQEEGVNLSSSSQSLANLNGKKKMNFPHVPYKLKRLMEEERVNRAIEASDCLDSWRSRIKKERREIDQIFNINSNDMQRQENEEEEETNEMIVNHKLDKLPWEYLQDNDTIAKILFSRTWKKDQTEEEDENHLSSSMLSDDSESETTDGRLTNTPSNYDDDESSRFGDDQQDEIEDGGEGYEEEEEEEEG